MTRAVFWAACAGLVAACADSTGVSTDLVLNRLRWDEREPGAYAFDFQRLCFCTPESTQPVRILVQSGRVVGVVSRSDNQPVPQEQIDQYFRITIDSLFGIVAEALDRDAAHVNVRYDPRWYYPTAAQIDYQRNVVDEELGFTAEFLGPRAIEGPGGIP